MTQPDYSIPAPPPPATASEAASHVKLQRLHNLLANALLDYFTRTEPAKLRASMMDVARGFLKDNGIAKNGGNVAEVRKGLESLTLADMPFDVVKH